MRDAARRKEICCFGKSLLNEVSMLSRAAQTKSQRWRICNLTALRGVSVTTDDSFGLRPGHSQLPQAAANAAVLRGDDPRRPENSPPDTAVY
eukprot:13277861-Alexandrium_andersonii.AAC.1